MSSIPSDLPVAVVANFTEAHRAFLNRGSNGHDAPSLATMEAYHADRALLWVGDPKLVIASYPMPHAPHLCAVLGYDETAYAVPAKPTDCLSLDVLADETLRSRLIVHAGPHKTIRLIPYATTPEFLALADALRRADGLRVLLPESPLPSSLWLRDFIDTKSGFHFLAGRWLAAAGDLLPEAYFCSDLAEAAARVAWFLRRGVACIVKPDTGESGIGSVVFRPGEESSEGGDSEEAIVRRLKRQPYWGDDLIVVEEFIASERPASPSIEVLVPPAGEGAPYVTYVCEQLFHGFGDFGGVLVASDLQTRSWYQPCVDSALSIAANLQERGYAGHFDLDVAVGPNARPFLLEINARRTGGTHVHEFARRTFGSNYLERVALISWESIHSGGLSDYQDLAAHLADLLYPVSGEPRGVLITITSSLRHGRFGVLIVGSSAGDALALQSALLARMRQSVG